MMTVVEIVQAAPMISTTRTDVATIAECQDIRGATMAMATAMAMAMAVSTDDGWKERDRDREGKKQWQPRSKRVT